MRFVLFLLLCISIFAAFLFTTFRNNHKDTSRINQPDPTTNFRNYWNASKTIFNTLNRQNIQHHLTDNSLIDYIRYKDIHNTSTTLFLAIPHEQLDNVPTEEWRDFTVLKTDTYIDVHVNKRHVAHISTYSSHKKTTPVQFGNFSTYIPT